jgi:ATP-binding cassette subfamily B protein
VLKGEIEFRNLNFQYGETPVLDGISLKIPAGSSLAIVGPTGSGKTTLVNLVSRMYEAPEGSLLIDGRPVREYPLAVLRRNIGMIPQETFLFSETIRENLAFGAPHAGAEELLEAAEAAHIRREFEEFPQGFETMVGERGVTLSGGQRQRIAIARAVIRDTPILILDEPTAGLDAGSEKTVMEALDKLMKGRTSVVIAHRLGTIRHADVIFVVKDTGLSERGTHEELMALNGVYAELFRIQTPEESATPA